MKALDDCRAAKLSNVEVHTTSKHGHSAHCTCPCHSFDTFYKIDSEKKIAIVTDKRGNDHIVKRVDMRNKYGNERRCAMREATFCLERIVEPIDVFPLIYRVDVCKCAGDFTSIFVRTVIQL